MAENGAPQDEFTKESTVSDCCESVLTQAPTSDNGQMTQSPQNNEAASVISNNYDLKHHLHNLPESSEQITNMPNSDNQPTCENRQTPHLTASLPSISAGGGGGGSGAGRVNDSAQKHIYELLNERNKLEDKFPLAVKLIDEALERLHLNGRIPPRDQYADIYQQRTIKLIQKVHIPIKDKKFNYVGKLLGPKGNSLRRLQEETQCKIVILGRFSMKDRVREEELRNSADAKYAHLNLPLHVEVSTVAPPAEAYARVAYALAELRRYMIPDKFDDIRQEQFRELMGDSILTKKLHSYQQPYHHQANVGATNGHSANYNIGYRNSSSHNSQYRQKYPTAPPVNHHYHYVPGNHTYDENFYYRSHHNVGMSISGYHYPSAKSNLSGLYRN